MERYREIIPRWEEFKKVISQPIPQAIRVNTLKITPEKLKKVLESNGWRIEESTYFRYVFIIKDKNSIANTLEHYLGWFYIQEITSLIAPLVLDPKPKEKILDLCAAPGGKTTFMAQLMKNQGLIVANDISFKRLRALMANIYRLGVTNTVVTDYHALFFPQDVKFDKVLVDVPCSAEGNVRKSPQRVKCDLKFIQRISSLQKGILIKAIDLVKKGGVVVYSTCTFSPEENEEILNYVLTKKEIEIEKIKIDIPFSCGITSWQDKIFSSQVKKAIRMYPHHINSGGGFVAKIVKK